MAWYWWVVLYAVAGGAVAGLYSGLEDDEEYTPAEVFFLSAAVWPLTFLLVLGSSVSGFVRGWRLGAERKREAMEAEQRIVEKQRKATEAKLDAELAAMNAAVDRVAFPEQATQEVGTR